MSRLIDPPRQQHDKLLTPLTDGERRVIDVFDTELPPEWEIYIQPHLNGLRPDIVLLHPGVGVAVFEVKDWDLGAMHYYAKTVESGRQVLMARDGNGKAFSREAENPINKILLYKEELFDLYCPRLDNRAGFAVITAGLIFPCAPRSEVERVFGPFREAHDGMSGYPQYYPISGIEDVSSGNLAAIFPESKRQSSQVMSSAIADDLRGWLKEPFFSQEQRTPLELDARQRDLATTRTDTGYRRIKGPAGCGKSVVLAARASSLAAEGKHTLVVSFNITLLNYLRDLAVRHDAARSVIRRQIDFLNFHYWCKRICLDTGHEEEYKKLWALSSDGDVLQSEPVLSEGLPSLIQRLYREGAGSGAMPRYDAILVDEGQDFRPSWWQTLRLALKAGGEMVLVADKTQNIYATAAAWTEETMANAGFRGPWAELKISYRLPPAVVALVSRFAEEFLTDEEIDIPQVEQRENQLEFAEFFPVELRWVHVREQSNGLDACVSELRRMMQRLRTDTGVPDITVLSGTELGRSLTDLLTHKGVHVLHTFDKDKQISRRQKRAFFQGAARIKATTLHSFKGWEARHLVLFVGSVERAEDRALIYTALTRLRRHEAGSALTVVSCCPELFTYGQSWPDFVEAWQAQ
ncbi:NERD domain-containing protein [Prosthecochloris sp. N3]|uniref:DNA 3'-5' helicase II n=1 Tax=Prosthecochloris ethylica TaxID=2743976 RepID=A0ABR9XS51_9CHLB|nr:NERD domain-containing protein [Prosthecochloris ethylica]MBF0586720.1 NERD domain-containing protein [Prosthecochloris ethylica]MBF0636626.1 NERD domain-containing protein [Prosthecochloris ethylica]NUK47975.1 NERD domain-containing protein [Prosthecochloris ethylica]